MGERSETHPVSRSEVNVGRRHCKVDRIGILQRQFVDCGSASQEKSQLRTSNQTASVALMT
jgi:hypothetical protein